MTQQHPQRCCHHDVCYMIHAHNKCINDTPNEIPCIFDSRKGVNFSNCATHTPAAPAEQMSEAMGNLVKVACEQAAKAEREQVLPVLEQCKASLERAIERSNELHEMASALGATPQNQGQYIALLESTIKDIESLRGGGAP